MSSNIDYAIVLEKGEKSWGAYVPDLPGCVATAGTREAVITLIKEAIVSHIGVMKKNGESIPLPTCHTLTVSV